MMIVVVVLIQTTTGAVECECKRRRKGIGRSTAAAAAAKVAAAAALTIFEVDLSSLMVMESSLGVRRSLWASRLSGGNAAFGGWGTEFKKNY